MNDPVISNEDRLGGIVLVRQRGPDRGEQPGTTALRKRDMGTDT